MPDVRVQTGSAATAALQRPASPPTGTSPTPPVPATGFVALLPPSFGQILGDMMTTVSAVRAAPLSTGRDAMKPAAGPETALEAAADHTLSVDETAKPVVTLRPKEGTNRTPPTDRRSTETRADGETGATSVRTPEAPNREAMDDSSGEVEMTDAALVAAVAPAPTAIPVIDPPEVEATTPVLPPAPSLNTDPPDPASGADAPKADPNLSPGPLPEEIADPEATLDPVNAKPMTRPTRTEGLPSDLLEAAKPPVKETTVPAMTTPKPEAGTAALEAAGTAPVPEPLPATEPVSSRADRVIESAVVATKVAAQAASELPSTEEGGGRARETGTSAVSPTGTEVLAGSTRAIAAASAGGASAELSGGMSGNLAGSESGGAREIGAVTGRGGSAPSFADRMTALTEARANQAEMIDRIVQQTRMGVEHGQTRIRMQLNPPALGHLRLDLGVQDGVLSARLQTETQAAQVVLQTHLDTLRDSLEQQGIIVGSFEVSVRQQGQSGAAFAFGRPNFGENTSRAASRRSNPEPEPALAGVGADSSGRGWHLVDMFA
ncbi:MAG: flagellar hook-length control protein FliK [Planctomycetes bacterium]|nr:flagellar hook-length control protein FliK [Planctomycetota bacterium]